GRRESGDLIDVGLGQLAHELPRVRAERLDVTPLAFGVERIEGQRALAAAADAGEADQLAFGQGEADAAQVVYAGVDDMDRVARVLAHRADSRSRKRNRPRDRSSV